MGNPYQTYPPSLPPTPAPSPAHRQQRAVPRASAERPTQPPPTQAPSSHALQRSAHPCRRTMHAPGRRPRAPRGRCVRHQRAQVHTPPSRPKHPGYEAQHRIWASARGQLNAALHVSASAPSASAPSAQLREVQVGMAAAAKDGARSRAWEAHAAAAAALTGQNAGQGGCCQRPGPEAPPPSAQRPPRPWTRRSASVL